MKNVCQKCGKYCSFRKCKAKVCRMCKCQKKCELKCGDSQQVKMKRIQRLVYRCSTTDVRSNATDVRPTTTDVRPNTKDTQPSTADVRSSTTEVRSNTTGHSIQYYRTCDPILQPCDSAGDSTTEVPMMPVSADHDHQYHASTKIEGIPWKFNTSQTKHVEFI